MNRGKYYSHLGIKSPPGIQAKPAPLTRTRRAVSGVDSGNVQSMLQAAIFSGWLRLRESLRSSSGQIWYLWHNYYFVLTGGCNHELVCFTDETMRSTKVC
jgi:hypothetical protein